MFLPIQFRDKEGPYTEHINVTHITRTSFVNQMNPDAGTKIHLRTGEVLTTPVTMDVISAEIDGCWRSAATLVIFNVLAEKAKVMTDEDMDEDLQFQENV
jgi:hypothetical protein